MSTGPVSSTACLSPRLWSPAPPFLPGFAKMPATRNPSRATVTVGEAHRHMHAVTHACNTPRAHTCVHSPFGGWVRTGLSGDLGLGVSRPQRGLSHPPGAVPLVWLWRAQFPFIICRALGLELFLQGTLGSIPPPTKPSCARPPRLACGRDSVGLPRAAGTVIPFWALLGLDGPLL